MNRIYRVVWNHALNAWQVASELAGGRSRVRSQRRSSRRQKTAILAASAALIAANALAVPAVFFDGVVSSGQTNFSRVVASAAPSATVYSYDFASASTGTFMVSAGGTNVYVQASRNGSISSFSYGLDGWSVGVSNTGTDGWNEIVSEGFRLDFYSDASYTTRFLINAVGISVDDWGTCCTASNIQADGTSAPGSAIYAVFDPDGAPSTNLIGGITGDRADTDDDNRHFVAAIDDRNSFSSVVIAPNGNGEYFGAGGTLLFSVVGIGTVPAGSSVVTVGAPVVPDIDTAQSAYTTADLAAASVNPVFAGGTLQASSSGTVSNNFSVNNSGGTIDANGYNVTFSGVISDAVGASGSMRFTGSGQTTLSGANTYTGSTTIDGGNTLNLTGSLASTTISIASGATLNDSNGGLSSSAAVTANGAFNLGANEAINSLSGSGTVGLGSNTLTVNQGSFSGVIGGSGSLTKASGGALTLSGANTYTGATAVNGGTLTLSGSLASTAISIANGATLTDSNGGLSSSAAVTANGTFNLGANEAIDSLNGSGTVGLGSNTLSVNQGSFSGVIGGTGGLTKASAGDLTLSGTNTYSGGTTVNGGRLIVGADANLGDAAGPLALNNGTLQTTASFTTTRATQLSNTGTIVTDTGTTLIDNGAVSGSGALVKDGSGTLQLCGDVSHSGGTTVSGGRLDMCGNLTATGAIAIDAGATLGVTGSTSLASASGVTNNGTLDISGTLAGVTMRSLNGAGDVLLGTKNMTLSNAVGSFSGIIAGSGGLTISGGSQTLSGLNTYTGATVIDSGASLALLGLGQAGVGSTLVNGGAFSIAGSSGGVTLANMIGDGSIALGSNELTLSNASGNFDGVISGTGSLNVAGGTATLGGNNTYSGGTTIGNGATVRVSADANLGDLSGVVRLDGGTLQTTASFSANRDIEVTGNGALTANAGTTLDNAGDVSGTGSLIKNGTGTVNLSGDLSHGGGTVVNQGTLQLSGTNSYAGGTTLNGGTLRVASDSNLGQASGGLIFNGGSLQATASFDSARAISATANSGVVTDTGATLNLSGGITGSGQITKSGDGTLVLSGDSSGNHTPGSGWTGGMVVNGGLVQVTNAWGLGWGDVTVNGGTVNTTVDILTGQTLALAGGTTVNVDANTTTTLSGTVTDGGMAGGCFIKSGTGTLNLTGSMTQANGTCVQQGELRANGSLASDVTVDSAGTLRGTGVISGTTTVQGRLAPGNSPGTLISAGTVTMLAGSTFQVDINGLGTGSGPGNYSRLLVTGAGNQFVAGGATLDPNLTAITGGVVYTPYVPNIGDSFRIVTAEGGIVGRFAPLTQPNGLADGTRMVAFYNVFNSNSIDLTVIPSSYANFLGGANANARSAGAALDKILTDEQNGNGSTAQSQLAYRVASLGAGSIQGVFTALAGEVHGALVAVSPLAGQWVQSAAGRQVGTAGVATDLREEGGRPAFWVDVGGDQFRWSGDSTASGFQLNRTLFALGSDVYATRDLNLGAGFSSVNSRVGSSNGSGSVEENMLFAYGRYRLGDYAVDGIVGYGANRFETQRNDPLGLVGSLNSSIDGRNAMAGVTVRRAINFGQMIVEPNVRVLYQHSTRDAGSEGSSPAALRLERQVAQGMRGVVGASIGSAQRDPFRSDVTYQVNVGLGYDHGDALRPTLQASLADSSMTIQAPSVGRGFAEVGAFATKRVAAQAFVFIGVSGEARSGKSGFGGNAGLRIAF